MNSLKEIIQKIKTGTREEIRTAQKELEKFWHGNVKNRKVFIPLLKEIEKFDSIKDINNQAAFISALKWPFLNLSDTHFSCCKDFALRVFQNKSGKLRQAMIHSADYIVMSFHLFAIPLKDNIPIKEQQIIKEHRLLFCQLIEEVKELIEKYYEPKFKRHKYISSLPPSIYKSLQIFLSNLLRSDALENIYLEYQYEKYKQTPEEFNMPGLKLVQKEKEWDYYYDAMEYLNLKDTRMAEILLQKAIEIDKDFVAGYVGMVAVARDEADIEKEKKYTNLAYAKTQKYFPKWPTEMRWGILENRQYLRAVCDKAILHQETGDLKEAEKLYRLILKLNPNDNQGVRYLIAGMFAGLSPKDIDELFDEGNNLQNWDKLEKLLAEQDEKYHFWT